MSSYDRSSPGLLLPLLRLPAAAAVAAATCQQLGMTALDSQACQSAVPHVTSSHAAILGACNVRAASLLSRRRSSLQLRLRC